MGRREFLSVGSLIITGTVAGCLGTIQSDCNILSEADRTQFTEIESIYVVSVRNQLNKSVGVEVSVTDAEGATMEENITVEPEDRTLIRSLFTSESYTRGSEPYTVSASADGKTTERTLRPSGSLYDEFAFTIASDEIRFQKSRRPSADISISNQLDEDVDVRVTTCDQSDSGAVYDILTIPSHDVVSYRGVFADGREYDSTIEANGMTRSITHLNSFTNSISIAIERHTISTVVSEA